MKTTSKSVSKIVLAALAAVLLFGGASNLMADDHWDYGYRHDHYGYWDRDNHYHHYVYWHNHPGYWGYRGPVRVFISCG